MRLIEFLEKKIYKYPDKTAVIDTINDIHYSYNQLYADIKSLAYFLDQNGIISNQRVVLYSSNSYFQIIAFFSLLHIGAIPVLIDANSCENEILVFLEYSESKTIISESRKKDILIELLKKENLSVFVFSDEEKKTEKKTNEKIIEEKIVNINYKIIKKNKNNIKQYKDNGKIILFTYRGYGFPLATVISERAIINSVKSNIHVAELNTSTNMVLLLPFSHVFALMCNVLSPLCAGGSIVIIKSIRPGQILSLIEKYKVNFIIAVPTLIIILIHYIKKNNFKLTTLKRGIIGGNSFSEKLFNEWHDLTGAVLLQGYGLTETSAVFCNQWNNNKPDSIGKTMRGSFAKIVDNGGNELAIGKTGKLMIKTHSLMEGYYRKPEITKEVIKDGWMDTGDLAWKDEDDFFYFVKRDKMIAKIGGLTVDIKEVENVINMHPDIEQSEIFNIEDSLWQEKLVCKIKTNKDLTRMDIHNYFRQYLSSSKIPKDIIIKKGCE